jgi:putative transposase
MDAKGRWADNIYMERFWRTLKYECILLLGIENAYELHIEVNRYIEYYNSRRLHSSLGYKCQSASKFHSKGAIKFQS